MDARWGEAKTFPTAVKTLSIPLGSMVARLKLKGIDGGSHKRWSMLLNSILREEPYPGSKRTN